MIPTKALRATFHDTLRCHGGTWWGGVQVGPAGEGFRVTGSQFYLRFSISVWGYGEDACSIALDRTAGLRRELPTAAGAWLTEHIGPYTARAAGPRRHNPACPGTHPYAVATIRRADVTAVLDVWIPQEKQWQEEAK